MKAEYDEKFDSLEVRFSNKESVDTKTGGFNGLDIEAEYDEEGQMTFLVLTGITEYMERHSD